MGWKNTPHENRWGGVLHPKTPPHCGVEFGPNLGSVGWSGVECLFLIFGKLHRVVGWSVGWSGVGTEQVFCDLVDIFAPQAKFFGTFIGFGGGVWTSDYFNTKGIRGRFWFSRPRAHGFSRIWPTRGYGVH